MTPAIDNGAYLIAFDWQISAIRDRRTLRQPPHLEVSARMPLSAMNSSKQYSCAAGYAQIRELFMMAGFGYISNPDNPADYRRISVFKPNRNSFIHFADLLH